MKSALRSFVGIWKPVYGEVYPRALRQFFRDEKSVFHEAWMHYLSGPLAQRIEPPRDILVERLPDGGILMSATTDAFDVDNPTHLAGARAIEAAIRPLNSLTVSEYATG